MIYGIIGIAVASRNTWETNTEPWFPQKLVFLAESLRLSFEIHGVCEHLVLYSKSTRNHVKLSQDLSLEKCQCYFWSECSKQKHDSYIG